MLKELVKVANRLDHLGLQKEADIIDNFIQKIAIRVIEPGDYDYDPVQGLLGREWELDVDGPDPHHDFLMNWEDQDPSLRIITDTEHESYNPHEHGTPSYEMDIEEIEEGIDKERELEKIYPAVTSYRRG
jgi:hypothetical protein